jgi:hypothetical protein
MAGMPRSGCRRDAGVRFLFVAGTCIALAACTRAGPASAPPAAPVDASAALARAAASAARPAALGHTVGSENAGFRIDVPTGWQVRRRFDPSYLANAAWKTYAGPGSHGRPMLALILPGSDRITDAEIRIGTSHGVKEVRACTATPPAVRAGSASTQRIGDIVFTTFESGDAAMSHRLKVHAYRVVHDGTCYAIDLLVFGTDPSVYDPPAQPPFTDAEAFARMHEVVQTFRFTR